MQTVLRRSMVVPLHYWRTVLLVLCAGFTVSAALHDATAVLLSTIACAFVFGGYERRRWIIVPTELIATDVFVRIALAFGVTYLLAGSG